MTSSDAQISTVFMALLKTGSSLPPYTLHKFQNNSLERGKSIFNKGFQTIIYVS
jgi:hypothetical protein